MGWLPAVSHERRPAALNNSFYQLLNPESVRFGSPRVPVDRTVVTWDHSIVTTEPAQEAAEGRLFASGSLRPRAREVTMDMQPLTACVATALRDNRVRFGDVRRLERAMPRGDESVDALELLLALDRAVSRTDRAWAEFLVDRTRRLVTGAAAEERRALAERVAALIGGRPTVAGAAIRADLAVELLILDPPLAGLFAPSPARRPGPRATRAPSMVFATEAEPAVPELSAEAVPPIAAGDGQEITVPA